MKTIRMKRLSEDSVLPTRAYNTDAGLDLYAARYHVIDSGEVAVVSTDIALMIDAGWVGMIKDRSSVSKTGLKVTAGIIDHGFKGHCQVAMINTTDEIIVIQKGQKIAQLLVLPIATPTVEEVTEFPTTERADKGWGSSGT